MTDHTCPDSTKLCFGRLVTSDEEALLSILKNDFLNSPFYRPNFVVYEPEVPKIDLLDDGPSLLLHPSKDPIELREVWDFSGNVIGCRESLRVGSEDAGGQKMLMDPTQRPPAMPGSDPLVGFVKLPFWPGGIDNVDDVKGAQDDTGTDSFDPWKFPKQISTCAPDLSCGADFPPGDCEDIFNDFDIAADDTIDELLFNPFDDLIKEEESVKKPAVVVDLAKLNLPVSSSYDMQVAKDKQQYKWAVRVDPKEVVSNEQFKRKVPQPAKTWPFTLDNFQKQAVMRLEEHCSVLVAAHTSAGKSVVAEYAIALSQQHRSRCIYTSPIKALSNQKYRDFRNTFGEDVGIITGDIQLNPKASCLIMTTEILRSMLYNGSDAIRDTEWVVFDEVHYVNDPERGHVWEESIILLPDSVNIIALSATVPNVMDFAEWIGQIKKRKMYVITTAFRPVPLEHNLCVSWTIDKLFPILKPHSETLDQKVYGAALSSKSGDSNKPASGPSKQQRGGGSTGGHSGPPGYFSPQQELQAYLGLIRSLQSKGQLPAVVFVFSKKGIENLTEGLSSKIDLLSAKERNSVHNFITRALSRLKADDRGLPQIQKQVALLKVGIGMHHSGILPILKEMVELLFQRGLCRLLFATETFAMGVNMPAKTVVFDSVRKSDGKQRRYLQSSEYIQMAGRAGRRGLDTTGTVIVLCKGAIPEISELDRMMLGKPTHLESKFRLTTTLVLNLIRCEQLRMEDMLRRTFAEAHWFGQKSILESDLEKQTVERRKIVRINCQVCLTDIVQFHDTLLAYWGKWAEFQKKLFEEKSAANIFSPGRIIFVFAEMGPADFQLRPAIFLSSKIYPGKPTVIRAILTTNASQSLISARFPDIYASPDSFILTTPGDVVDRLADEESKLSLVEITPLDIACYYTGKALKLLPSQTSSLANEKALLAEIEPEFVKFLKSCSWASADSLGDPVKSIQLSSFEIATLSNELAQMRSQLANRFVCRQCPEFSAHLWQVADDQRLARSIAHIRFQLSPASLTLGADYEATVKLLADYNFIDGERSVLLLKGHVACAIGQKLDCLITEFLLSGTFSSLTSAEIPAVLCPFVCEVRSHDEDTSDEQEYSTAGLQTGVSTLRKLALTMGQSMLKLKLVSSAHYLLENDLSFQLVEPIYAWANGVSFGKVKELTDVGEGLIVRCIQRLDELLRDLRGAARLIGNSSIDKLLEESQTRIRRDIVFCASLYLSSDSPVISEN